jgi:hypothetical protein
LANLLAQVPVKKPGAATAADAQPQKEAAEGEAPTAGEAGDDEAKSTGAEVSSCLCVACSAAVHVPSPFIRESLPSTDRVGEN